MINITDTDHELLLMAAETIRLYCKGVHCNDCLFWKSSKDDTSSCGIARNVPAEWRLNCDKES